MSLNKFNSFIICYSLVIFMFLQVINQIIATYEVYSIISLFFSICLSLGKMGLIYSCLISIKSIKKDLLVVLACLFIMFSITYFFYNQNMRFFEEFNFLYYFQYGFLSYFLIRQNVFNKRILNDFIFIFTLLCGLTLIFIKSENVFDIPYMEFGFAMLIPTLSSIYLSLNKNKLLYYAISIFYSFYLVLYSHRGAMLCLGVFIIIMCIYYLLNMKLTRKNMILISFIIALVITIYLKLDDLIIGLLRFLESRNMESRTLRLLLEGNLGNDSGRGFIQDFFISNLGNNLLGNGLYGDRYLYSVGNGIATYPHNLFLELCIDFGIIIGTLLSIFLIFYSVKNYLWNKTISFEYFAFISIFFCASFVQLLISSSFLASIPLWIYISLLFTKEKDFWGNLENKEFY